MSGIATRLVDLMTEPFLYDGLWSANGGMLRSSVEVSPGHDSWKMRHSIWELEVPVTFVSREPGVLDFLQRRVRLRDISVVSHGAPAFFQLLAGQGCLTYDGTRESYSLDDLRYVVTALLSQWYGIYYSHPFWTRLSRCELSLPQLFAWVLRTYHLSRSAGATAARGTVYAPNRRVREVFLKSTLEEYPHCDQYYFPHHEAFGVELASVKHLLPFVSSTAFDNQMAIIAEEDWLAHTIVAYFQEYTATFKENAFALYDRIESAYGLTHFFDGWKQHIGYDVGMTHADDFDQLLQGDGQIPRESILKSIKAAAATVGCLISALDELAKVEYAADLRGFRVPPTLLMSTGGSTSILGISDSSTLLAAQTCADVCAALSQIVSNASADKGEACARTLAAALSEPVLAHLFLRALSHSNDHDTIMLLGGLLEAVGSKEHPDGEHFAPIETFSAIVNFLRESAVAPSDFVFLVSVACDLSGLGAKSATLMKLYPIIQPSLRARVLNAESRARMTTMGLQFAEMCQVTAGWRQSIPDQDVLGSDANYQ